jgi:hypothetical protein
LAVLLQPRPAAPRWMSLQQQAQVQVQVLALVLVLVLVEERA